ncbi:MAG TPA: carboxypeptidase-like regulatory domain-containing protein, partial [Acidobacteriaceae bacterium]|nr:carboxypeptidase-like regulatory domain-containing protein [Acidobacteriaceae bacterium]
LLERGTRYCGMRALGILRGGCFGWIAAVALFGSSIGFAWQSASTTVGGTVTGHVICGDTQRPARFATVILFGVPEQVTPPPKPGAKSTAVADYKKAMDSLNMVETQTDLEGAFSVRGVLPGDYYVFSSMPGYILPNFAVEQAYGGGSDLHYPIPGIPTVHVVSERSAQIDLTAERGAVIAGRVVWDDGSPAGRMMLTAVKAKGKKELPLEFAMLSITGGVEQIAFSDDRGHFRIVGLAPGDYLVKANVSTKYRINIGGANSSSGNDMDSPLFIFAPAAFHQADAKPITLHAGEERDDVEVSINLKSMYSVSGRVSSREDHHGINSATVKLTDVQDQEFSRMTHVDTNGDFTVTYVPAGSYKVEVLYARDTQPSQEKPSGQGRPEDIVLRSYEDKKQSVTVLDSDVRGQNFELTSTNVAKKELNPDQ